MKSHAQQVMINEKILKVTQIFLETNLSDREISALTGIPASSVGRYLTCEDTKNLIGEYTYRIILERRRANLLAAKAKGGKNFAQGNDALKDENGKFTGSQRK